MNRERASPALKTLSVLTLVGHEGRILLQNRMGCAVLLSAVLVAALLRLEANQKAGGEPAGETCYVVYWQRNDWVEALRRAAGERDPEQPPIRVVPADELTGPDGVIRYPRGCHSIQLRPLENPESAQQRWLVWYWYAGADASALFPYSRWFWRVTSEHFAEELRCTEKVTALQPELSLPVTGTRLDPGSLRHPERIGHVMIWLAVFFAACHLPGLSLAEARSDRSIESLVVSPAGWWGVGLAKRVFYLLLAVSMASVMTALLNPSALAAPRFWVAVVCAGLVYLGVAFVLGSWCRTVAGASVATMAYALLAGAAYAAAVSLQAGVRPALVSAEWAVLAALQGLWSDDASAGGLTLLPLLAWAVLWQLLGEWSYRRLRRG